MRLCPDSVSILGAASYPFARRNRTALSATIEKLEVPEADWCALLRDAVRDPAELARLLELPADSLDAGADADDRFPLLVPRGFVARMQKRDPVDPLLLQVLPTRREQIAAPGFGPDPVDEQALARSGGIRKYPGRALLIATAACPVHCRYCFRRDFPYAEQTAARADWEPALAAVARSPELTEVILSGGDPLSLDNERLARLLTRIEAIPSVRTLRIHSRFPVVLPERIDRGLVALLGATRLETVVVLHANHPAEIDESVAAATARLKPVTPALLNQSVLLAGINDSVATLKQLSERLLTAGVLPYYLHLLDRVAGAAHFEIAENAAIALVAEMRRQVPGYLVPRLVRERPGELSKTPVA
jgi:EF-P beta-lysylation protein EpmB